MPLHPESIAVSPRDRIRLTAVMPCLNEERTVGVCIEKAFKAFRSMGIVGETGCGKSVTARSILRIVERPGRIVGGEILLRRGVVQRRGWLFFLVTCVCLAFSAFYELVEWWTAEATGGAATAFLGTQGDPWDTQWDMFFALTGALVSQLLLGRAHDRQLI